MRVVLLSGGVGSRLWPLSNGRLPKQFYPLFRNENGESVSMLQRIWGQLRKTGLYRVASICAAGDQVSLIREQLGEVSIIQEPHRRDTFGAIALSTLACASYYNMRDEETILVLPADHLADDEFYREASKLPVALRYSGADLATLGIRPNAPRTKFGYLLLGEATAAGIRVSGFIEKPSAASAIRLVQAGALWNSGVYCFSVGYLKGILRTLGYPTHYREMTDHYGDLPINSFDRVVAEKATHIIAKTYLGNWSDLGTWDSFLSAGEVDSDGNSVLHDSEGTRVVNKLPMPVVVNGLKDIIVVATGDGILVTGKSAADAIKDALKETG